jgi:uncharacterized protein YjdB
MASAPARQRAGLLLTLVLLALSSGCGDSVGPNGVASVKLTGVPAGGHVFLGFFAGLNAELHDADGNVIPVNILSGIPIGWTSSNPAVASVNASAASAEVDGLTVGSSIITVTADGKKASAQINVVPVPVSSVTVSPPSADVAVGMTTQLTATVLDVLGVDRPEKPVTWTSSNQARATVSSEGVVSGVAAGTATITAAVEGHFGTSSVNVVN